MSNLSDRDVQDVLSSDVKMGITDMVRPQTRPKAIIKGIDLNEWLKNLGISPANRLARIAAATRELEQIRK